MHAGFQSIAPDTPAEDPSQAASQRVLLVVSHAARHLSSSVAPRPPHGQQFPRAAPCLGCRSIQGRQLQQVESAAGALLS